jgi:hypothetical protein
MVHDYKLAFEEEIHTKATVQGKLIHKLTLTASGSAYDLKRLLAD